MLVNFFRGISKLVKIKNERGLPINRWKSGLADENTLNLTRKRDISI